MQFFCIIRHVSMRALHPFSNLWFHSAVFWQQGYGACPKILIPIPNFKVDFLYKFKKKKHTSFGKSHQWPNRFSLRRSYLNKSYFNYSIPLKGNSRNRFRGRLTIQQAFQKQHSVYLFCGQEPCSADTYRARIPSTDDRLQPIFRAHIWICSNIIQLG